MIILLRLCPIAPCLVVNYMLGITSIRMRDFVIGGLGMIPGLSARLFVGSTLSELTKDSISLSSILQGSNTPIILTMVIAGLIVGISGMIYITALTKRYIRQLE